MAGRRLNPLIGKMGHIPKGTRVYDVQEIVQLYQEVQNISEVGRRVGVCNRTVRSYLDEAGQPKLKTKLTPEHRARMGKLRKGCKLSEEHKRKIGRKGEKHHCWNGGKISTPCSFCGTLVQRYERHLGTISKVCCSSHKCKAQMTRDQLAGEKHWNWQGGITRDRDRIRTSIKYTTWRDAVLARDEYTCQRCEHVGGKIAAHHKIAFSRLLRKYDVSTYDQAMGEKRLWYLSNGETLCLSCHKKTRNYCWKASA